MPESRLKSMFETIDIRGSYFAASNISGKREKNARNKYGIPDSEEILALIDTTVFGSGKEGLAFCADKIYWKRSGKPEASMTYDQLCKSNFKIMDDMDTIEVSFGPQKRYMDISGSSIDMPDFRQLIDKIKHIMCPSDMDSNDSWKKVRHDKRSDSDVTKGDAEGNYREQLNNDEYRIYLKGKGKCNLFLRDNEMVLASGENRMTVGYTEIKKIKLNPFRKTRRYYFAPQCIIITQNSKFKITSRAPVFKPVTTLFLSTNEDLTLMSNLVHALHKILIQKDLQNRIKFTLGGYLHFSTIFLYPPIVIAPVFVGTDGSIVFTTIAIIMYLFVIIAAKTRKYDPALMAKNVKSVSTTLG